MQLTSLFQISYYTYKCIYYTNIKSDSYSQFGVDADLVGVGSLKVGVAEKFSVHYARHYITTPPY